MAFAMNLAAIPVKFVAIPVLAGLAAGTGALGAYVTGPATTATATTTTVVAALPSASPAMAPAATEQATPAKPATKPSCEQQTWPYLDGRCIGRSDDTRNVRVVMAPRTGEAAPAAATANLVTSDTVLRGPAANEPAAKKPAKRSEQPRQRSRDVTVREVGSRDGFKRVYSVHSVPSASGQSTTPVIVVRPLPLNAYSSR